MNYGKDKLTRTLENALTLVAGNLILGFAVNAFIVSSGIIMGGATGIGLIFARIIPVDIAVIVFVFNILMLLLGLCVLGKSFFLTTVTSSVLYPVFLGLWGRFPFATSITENPLLCSAFGGALVGLAVGMIMRIGSSSGGTDVLNLVMHKWFHLPISTCVWVVDIVILIGQVFCTDADHLLYGIILLVIESLVIDQVILHGQSQLQILVISKEFERIRREILTTIQAGATMIYVETGCARKKQKGVLCIIPKQKLHSTMKAIQAIDPSAFMTITQIKEVRGQGFTCERIPEKIQYEEQSV